MTNINSFQISFFGQRKMERIILNLKNLNANYLEKQHFKMETLQSAINAMRPKCWFGSVDLAEAFYSIPILVSERKFFRFWHDDKKFQFTALIMGLTQSPSVFTKILKPVFVHLRANWVTSARHILMTPVCKGPLMRHAYKIFTIQSD